MEGQTGKNARSAILNQEILLASWLMVSLWMGWAGAVGGYTGGSGGKTVTAASRTVMTRSGRLQGFVLSLPNPLSPVEVFLGIPYASPPVGVNRFSPTRNPVPWPETRMADRHPPSCPQNFPNLANETESLHTMSRQRRDYLLRIQNHLHNQSEDCLHLNIYAPAQGPPLKKRLGVIASTLGVSLDHSSDRQLILKVTADKINGQKNSEYEINFISCTPPDRRRRPVDQMVPLPVLVFIHGESFEWGSSHLYDGSVLSSYGNVVVITVNFRLGVLGFLNIGGWTKSKGGRLGNFGLMDQIAALGWIRENIAAFGGDPSRVTLIGHGTGAACIHFLMKSPAALPGLFHRGILMSGSSLAPWAMKDDAHLVAHQIAEATDCIHQDPESILNCLREMPMEKIQKTVASLKSGRRFSGIFGPSADGVVILSDTHSAMGGARGRSGRSEELPTYDAIFGITGAEAAYQLSAAATYDGIDATERDVLLRSFIIETYRYHQTEIFLTLSNEYTDWERVIQHPLNLRDSVIEALSDAQFVAPAIALGDSVVSENRNTYFYVMDPVSIQRPMGLRGLELALLFGTPLLNGLNPSSPTSTNFSKQDTMFAEVLISFFTNFARTGNPNEPLDSNFRISKERNRFKGITWETYEKTQRRYMEIGSKPKMKSQFRAHRVAIWLQLFPELQRTGQHDVLSGHGLLTIGDNSQSLPGWVNGSYVDVVKQREEVKGMTCASSQPHTPTASPSTSNTTSNSSSSGKNEILSHSEAVVYSTALSVTIAIGCSLLILNVLTFAGLYYRRDRKRQALAHQMHLSQLGNCLRVGEEGGDASQLRAPCAANDSERNCLQTSSPCNGTLKKGPFHAKQKCCNYLTPIDLVTQERSIIDVRYDTHSPFPHKSFL